ncbi:hypothetical protein FPV67DRAFT_238635 [Lyophyllum atratum]|nr:hypothetical protein FPV67DRAFT_238635 [Lyophyllum atratum]
MSIESRTRLAGCRPGRRRRGHRYAQTADRRGSFLSFLSSCFNLSTFQSNPICIHPSPAPFLSIYHARPAHAGIGRSSPAQPSPAQPSQPIQLRRTRSCTADHPPLPPPPHQRGRPRPVSPSYPPSVPFTHHFPGPSPRHVFLFPISCFPLYYPGRSLLRTFSSLSLRAWCATSPSSSVCVSCFGCAAVPSLLLYFSWLLLGSCILLRGTIGVWHPDKAQTSTRVASIRYPTRLDWLDGWMNGVAVVWRCGGPGTWASVPRLADGWRLGGSPDVFGMSCASWCAVGRVWMGTVLYSMVRWLGFNRRGFARAG